MMKKVWSFKKKFRVSGFTLVEMIIVMSIISIIITIGIVSYRSARQKTNDVALRRSDLKQYQQGLEVFANDNNTLYPHYPTAVRASTVLCPNLSMPACPEDPRPDVSGIYYMYITNGSGVTGTAGGREYVLFARLELGDEYWVVCSNGAVGTLPATTSIANGTCPL